MNSHLQVMLQQAIQAFQSGNFESADSILKRVLQADSKNLPALHILGLVKVSQSNYGEAADYLARAARIHPNDASIQYNLAKALSDSGNDKDALAHHKKAVALAPNNAEAWLSYGKTASNLGRYEDALIWYSNALSLKSDYAEAALNKGATLKELKRYEDAIEFAKHALTMNPNLIEAWSNKAVALKELKRFDEAITHYDKAISLKPDYHEAWSNKGVTLHELKRFDEAITCYDKVLSLKPDYHEAWSNKGVTLHELKRFDEAITHYDKAISLKPDYHEAWSNKGVTLHELKRFDEAITCYDKVLSLKPDYHEAWSNKGVTLHELKRFDEAITHYDKAISLKPDYHEAWSNKGVTLHELKRFDEAITHYDKAISLKPDYHEAWSNKAVALKELKRFDEAITCYDKVLSLKPDYDWLFGDLLHTKMQICSWSDFTDSLETLSKKVIASEKVVTPFALIALNDNASLHKKSSEIYSQNKFPFNNTLGRIAKFPEQDKIRVGYFSADFRNHAVSVLTAELFELHDKTQFEIIGFSFGSDDRSPMRKRVSQAFNQFIDVSGMSDLEIAKLSRELHIDIAVDLGGYTAHSRTAIFAHRASPIQVSYLGYLGTMGAEYFDYIFADKCIVPNGSESSYSEKIAYLQSYQANDRKRIISEKKFTRAELGLPETGFVFCSFNNNYKILPATFDGWMRILNAVEGSVLFLYSDNRWVEANLKREAEARDVDITRLIFGESISAEEYLARYRLCDLFLDTFPYNAGTTASDALWSGLPVLTLTGESFASRMAASLLNAIGLSELITNTQEEYEALAIDIATNPKKLVDIKLKLANNRLTAPLFDAPLFTKNLETAYIKMYEQYRAGLKPEHISIV